MGGDVRPSVIITRPKSDGDAFASQLRSELGSDVSIVLDPIVRITPVAAKTNAAGFVFTSSNAVQRAVEMDVERGPAWCVGNRTASQAIEAGFDAISADGTAEDLLKLIKDHPPNIPIAHIRGHHVRSDISMHLRGMGIDCEDVIAYLQEMNPLLKHTIGAIEGSEPTIIPLFSARATTLLFEQTKPSSSAQLISISPHASCGHSMLIAERPTGEAMLRATIEAFRAL